MTARIADTIAEIVEAQLPHKEDRRRFLDAARLLLDFDDNVRQYPDRQRGRLIRGEIETPDDEADVLRELRSAIKRVAIEEARPSDDPRPGYRILMAYIAGKGLRAAQQRDVLRHATLLLRELADEAAAHRHKKRSGQRYKSDVEDKKRWFRKTAPDMKAKYPRANKSVLAQILFKACPRRDWWSSWASLRSWAYKNCPEIFRNL